MKLLALEFSTKRRSAATFEVNGGEARLLAEATEEAARGGSPFPLIERALAGIEKGEIGGLAIGLGPGSYVGIRSALAVAQGWFIARGTMACGLGSAEAIAFEAWRAGRRGQAEVVIDAQRGEVYSATFDLAETGAMRIDGMVIAKGAFTENTLGPEGRTVIYPSAVAVGFLAARELKLVRPDELEAIYLREVAFVKAPPARVID